MNYQDLCGWQDKPKEVAAVMNTLPFPVFGDVWEPIKGTGKGKLVILSDIVTKVAGYFPNRFQTIGDCVSQGAAYAVDVIKAVDILLKGDYEEWISETATEDIYWGSRNIIGQGQLGNSDGSVGAWAAKWVTQYGALARGKYGDIDLTKYDGNKARQWGRRGTKLPDSLIEEIRKHPVGTSSLVTSYEQARDLLANGYAITVACNQGFSSVRDKDGFCSPQGNWNHQQSVIGVWDDARRPGVLIQNSWGPWNSGPRVHNQPIGSYFCDADVFERRMLSARDSFAWSGYEGYEQREINLRLF